MIIYENLLTCREEGLVKVLDFGELWQERDGLPVPLGLDMDERGRHALAAGAIAKAQAPEIH